MTNPLDRLKAGGHAILNVDQLPKDNHRKIMEDENRLFCLDASMISEKVYGKTALPITNMAMLGALASVSNVIRLNSVLETVVEFFAGEEADKAILTAQMAFKQLS